MKILVIVITFAFLLVGLVVLGLTDRDISAAATSIPNDEVARIQADNASAIATITITMTGVLNE